MGRGRPGTGRWRRPAVARPGRPEERDGGRQHPVAGPFGDQQGRLAARRLRPATPRSSRSATSPRVTGLPVSTTYRLASELVDWGGLERADARRATASACGSGSSGAGARAGRRCARWRCPSCRTCTRRRGRTCTWPCSTARRRSTWTRSPAARVRCAPGAAAGCRCTRPAWARCCWRTRRRAVPRAVAAGLRRYTAHTVVAPGHLRRALAEVRRTGVAYAREEMTLGSQSVAAPVLDADGGVVAALAVTQRRAAATSAGWPRRCAPRRSRCRAGCSSGHCSCPPPATGRPAPRYRGRRPDRRRRGHTGAVSEQHVRPRPAPPVPGARCGARRCSGARRALAVARAAPGRLRGARVAGWHYEPHASTRPGWPGSSTAWGPSGPACR